MDNALRSSCLALSLDVHGETARDYEIASIVYVRVVQICEQVS